MKHIIQLFILTYSLVCLAQTPEEKHSLSLEEALTIGIQNRFDTQANQLAIPIALNKSEQTKQNWLPTIHGSANIQYSPQLQNSMIPGGVLPGFDKNQLVPLTVKNQSVFSLHLKQPLFNAALNNKTKQANNEVAIQREKLKEIETQIKLSISQVYMNAQLRALQKKVAADILRRNKEYATIAEGKYKQGSLIENHFLRVQLDFENAKNNLQQLTQEYEMSLTKLKYVLNLSDTVNLTLSDSLDDRTNLSFLALSTTGANRSDLQLLYLEKQSHELELKANRQQVLPTISVVATYAQQYLSDNFNYDNPSWWSPFSFVGLQIRVPISQHYTNKKTKQEQQYKIKQTQWKIQQKQADIVYEVAQAQMALEHAIINMQTSKNNYDLAVRIFQNQSAQHELGGLDYTEVLNTEKSLNSTENNYIESAYALVVAQINLLYVTHQF